MSEGDLGFLFLCLREHLPAEPGYLSPSVLFHEWCDRVRQHSAWYIVGRSEYLPSEYLYVALYILMPYG